jgi:L-iditol 2-dehydrogenase
MTIQAMEQMPDSTRVTSPSLPACGAGMTKQATMKAVVYYAPGDVRVETLPVPACGDDELRVRVDACAVCGTDLKSYLNGNPRIKAPLTMGHEFSGLVETVGASVQDFATGERVVMATSISCGACYCCRRGWPNLCINLAPMGFSYAGGMAEYVTIPARALRNGHVVKVPPGIPPALAALAEPTSCAVNTAELCRIGPGDTVVVVGGGPLGLLNACVAKESGAARVILSGTNPARLKLAEAFGIDRLVNPRQEDLVEVVKAETDGIGADVAIIAAPAAEPQEQAHRLVRKRGTICLFASLPAGKSLLALDSRPIHYGELTVVGASDSSPAHVRRAVALLQAAAETASPAPGAAVRPRIPLERLVTHQLPLAGIHEAFALMQRGEALRVVLQPGREGTAQ